MNKQPFVLQDARPLVDCAMGRTPADLVIRNGRWVCVQTGEVIPNTDVAVKNGRVAYVGADASYCIGKDTQVIDAAERFLVPGLLDAHMHVESGMLTVTEFVRAVLPHGTTGMFVDPHEIANVFGLEGVKLMVDEAAQQPIHVFVQMPSCVPSAPGLETPGATIGPDEVKEAMTWPGIIGLGEMMNFPGVAAGDEKVHAEMAVARQASKVIGGHYASPNLEREFHGYLAGGAQDDHEGTRLEDALERARRGMHVMMRYGSAWHDVMAQARAITEMRLNSRMFLLCTDDCHSDTLVREGHMDRVVRHAISQGLAPMTAIQMATINTAEYFGVSRDMGMIAPGRWADLLLVSNLTDFKAEVVIARGKVAARQGRLQIPMESVKYPDWALHSVKLPRALNGEDFKVRTDAKDAVMAHIIGVIENQAPTRHLRLHMAVRDGQVPVDLERDIVKVALIDRHSGSGKIQLGFVQGFGFNEPCAVASTVAHDCHQLIVLGTDDECMAMAANSLAACGGGQAVVRRGELIGRVDLPIGGLMSNEKAEVVARKAASVLAGFQSCGCKLNNPNMQLSLLALVVIPALRISDLGLVDVNKFEIISVLE